MLPINAGRKEKGLWHCTKELIVKLLEMKESLLIIESNDLIIKMRKLKPREQVTCPRSYNQLVHS